jgi:ubiquinone/menaquinone biosynthesis C-methylase UbiE
MAHRPEKVDAIKRFDGWSATYEQSFTWKHFFHPVHLLMLMKVGDVGGLSILDLGCGTGDMLRRFVAAGAARLVGVDASDGMLEVASRLCDGYGNIELLAGSAESLPFPAEEFDIVTSCIAFHHFPDPSGALCEAGRVLKPGGLLFICDLDGGGIGGRVMLTYGRLAGADDHYYNRESLLELIMEAGLEPTSAVKVRLFPPTMLVIAARK